MSEALKLSLIEKDKSWQTVQISDHQFLSPLKNLFPGESTLEAFTPAGEIFDRASSQGLVAATGKIAGKSVGIIYNDFRVNGGSFTIASSKKANAFIKHLTDHNIPLVMAFNTIGVGIMEGRKVFMDSFGTMPALFDFRAQNIPLITLALGRCLGLGSILFQMGHYRIAALEKSSFNLTGPEVIRLFFGGDTKFDLLASGEKQFEENDLVQELADSPEIALTKAHAILAHWLGKSSSKCVMQFPGPIALGEFLSSKDLHESERRLYSLLEKVGESALEVFGQMSPVVRTFIVNHEGRSIGVFANPPGHANNLISLAALERYNAALSLFKSMGLPVISFLDTPGIDPRFEHQHNDIIRMIVNVGKRIIQYPHGHMGFAVGRCFGGATTLVFPKNFRSLRCVAVKGCQFGVMGESILEQLLESSPRLLEIRKEVRKTETENFQDLIESGVIDTLIEENEIEKEIEYFLYQVDLLHSEKQLPAAGASAHDLSKPQEAHTQRAPLHPQKPAARGFQRLRPRHRVNGKAQPRHLPQKYSQ